MKNVLLVAHFCDYGNEQSNNRFNYIADILTKAGHRVTVVTSSFCHRDKKQRDMGEQSSRGYDMVLLKEPSYQKNISPKRLFYSHKVFASNLRKYLKTCEKPDVVYVAIPSNDVGVVVADYCKRENIPLVVDIQDLWPEAFKLVFNMPVVSNIIFNPMSRQADKIYSVADKIIAVSGTYANRGLQACKKDKEGTVVFLGTELEAFDKSAESIRIDKNDGELWITYVGTLGHSYNIELIIDALNLLPDNIAKKVIFKVLGDGPLMQRFKDYSTGCKVNVEFLGRRGYGEMVAYLKKSDIAVNPISKGAAQSIINKHGDYAMAGLPVVSTQEAPEYRSLLEEYRCGINCGVESAEDVARALEMLIEDEALRFEMGRSSRKLGEEKFDRKRSYIELIKLIETIS